MIVVTSVNVNGIRAAAKKGFIEWLAATEADVICLQEVRSEPGQLPVELRDLDGWHAVWAPPSPRAGPASPYCPARSRSGPPSDSGRMNSTIRAGMSKSTCRG